MPAPALQLSPLLPAALAALGLALVWLALWAGRRFEASRSAPGPVVRPIDVHSH
jgi:hypothetical protein